MKEEIEKFKRDLRNLTFEFREKNNWVAVDVRIGSFDINPDGATIHGVDVDVKLFY